MGWWINTPQDILFTIYKYVGPMGSIDYLDESRYPEKAIPHIIIG